MKKIVACLISLPVKAGAQDDTAKQILNDLLPVSVYRNRILDAIIKAYPIWEESPIIWVGDFPYKIELIEHAPSHSIFLQMPVMIERTPCGKQFYKIASKRTVKLVYW